jgi:formate hydrogenlyase subunit 3/multisubunit Na+/H+ antiporter MnhD subunit
MVLLPISAGLAMFIIPERYGRLAKFLSFIIALGLFAASIYVFNVKPAFWPGVDKPIFMADTLSSFIGLGIAFFALVTLTYSFAFIDKDIVKYNSYVLITLGSSLGACYSANFLGLLIFWGVLALALYLLVNMSGTSGAAKASEKALVIIGGTDALMLFGVGILWAATGSFSMDKTHLPLDSALSIIAYLSIASASLAKAGAMPFHSWLPDVAEEAKVPVTAYLPASLDKLLGIYLLARISLDIFAMNSISNTILLVIGSVTLIFAVTLALVQHDMKRLLGYHAVSQVGYMIIGIGTASPIGIAGALFHMLNNAIYKSCLFLTSGAVEQKTGSTDMSKLGGLSKYMPVTFAACLVSSLAISGIPPFNGFVSKWMIYQGIIESAKSSGPLWVIWLVAAMYGSALTIASFMKLLHSVFLGRPARNFGDVKDVGLLMAVPMAILALLSIIFGIFAFTIPLKLFIIPAAGSAVFYIGTWSPGAATMMLVAGLIIGLGIYAFMKSKSFRTTTTFIGGEEPSSMDRVSGTEFYDTLKDMKWLGRIYKKEDSGSFDIYVQTKNLISVFTGVLQRLHNGVLPTYIVWCLLGMIGLFIVLFMGKI